MLGHACQRFKLAAGGNAGVDVLPQAGNDDGDNSDEPADDAAPAPAPAEADAAAAAGGGGGEGGGGGAAAAGPCSSSAAAAAAAMAGIAPADAAAAALFAAAAAADIEEMPDLNDSHLLASFPQEKKGRLLASGRVHSTRSCM